ncbi:MAG TPA: hypothetical protein VNL13_03675 [Sulfolobales archaeon]|nr:hypothetical protein [Sulfolobales archaeon]
MVGISSPASILSRVVLLEPKRPRITKNSPGEISTFISLRATTLEEKISYKIVENKTSLDLLRLFVCGFIG